MTLRVVCEARSGFQMLEIMGKRSEIYQAYRAVRALLSIAAKAFTSRVIGLVCSITDNLSASEAAALRVSLSASEDGPPCAMCPVAAAGAAAGAAGVAAAAASEAAATAAAAVAAWLRGATRTGPSPGSCFRASSCASDA